MKVKDIMSENLYTVEEETEIKQIAALMKEKGIGCVPVLKDGTFCGIITDRDLVIRGLSEGKKKASEIMSRSVVSINPENSVTEAARLMAKKKLYRLAVCRQGCPVGILSLADITRAKGFLSETACAVSEIYEKEE